jgi:hypothetical protein
MFNNYYPKMMKSFSIAFFLLISSVCFSQVPAVVDQPIEWFAIGSTSKLSSKINVYVDMHFRFVKGFDPMQFQYRIAPEWVFSKSISVAPLGFIFVQNFIYGDQPAAIINNERRFYQQIVVKHNMGKLAFHHRFRVEERIIQFHTDTKSSEGFRDDGFVVNQTRLRYRAMVSYPFNKPKIEAGAFFGSVYDEIFVSWGDKVTFNSPDQNRIYVGVGYQFSKHATLQTGFFYQALLKSNGTREENNIGLNTQFTYNFDFIKKEAK